MLPRRRESGSMGLRSSVFRVEGKVVSKSDSDLQSEDYSCGVLDFTL